MAVKFEILERRDDTSYHFKRYEDNKFVSDGNGFFSNLKTDEEKIAWKNAVIEWMQANNFKRPSDKVREAIQEVKDKLQIQEKSFDEPRSLIMPSLASVIAAAAEGKCDDEYIQELIQACSGELPTPKNMIHYAFEATVNNLKLELQKLKYMLSNLGINGFVIPVLDAVQNIVDNFFSAIDAIYDELLRKYAQLYYYYKKACTFKERLSDIEISEWWQKFKDELKRIAKEAGQDIVDYLYLIFSFEPILELVRLCKNLTQSTGNVWNNLLRKIKSLTKEDIKEFLGDLGKKMLDILVALLPLIGTLIGALLALKCSKDEETKIAEDLAIQSGREIATANGDDVSAYNENYFNDKQKEYQKDLEKTAIVYHYAVEEIYGYSLYPDSGSSSNKNDNPDNKDNTEDSAEETNSGLPCKITMCPPEEQTDTNSLFNNSSIIASSPTNVIVEFDKNIKNLVTYFQEGQHIRIDDVIARVDKVPVKSKIDCNVREVHPTYFLAEYYNSFSKEPISDVSIFESDYNTYISELISKKLKEDSPLEKIVEQYQHASYVYSFIKDYMSFFRFPELAAFTREHTSADAVAISTERFVEEYEAAAEDIITEYENRIQKIFTQDYIKPIAEKGSLIEIKDCSDEEKYRMINRILELYNSNPGAMTYCSEGRIQDFMLYSFYINYLYSDRFIYDEDNPYIVELYNAITDFSKVRQNIELNSYNVEGLTDKFNELCNEVLYQYWPVDISYYAKLKEMFVTDINVISDSSSTDLNDPAKDSIYKRVLNYLKQITNYTEPSVPEITYTEETDMNEFLNSQSSVSSSSILNQDAIVLERKLKKISYQFITLLKLETSSTGSDNVPDYYIGSQQHKKLDYLYKLNDNVLNHTEGETYNIFNNLNLHGNEETLDLYLQELKNQTAAETVRLRRIVKKAVDWYNENETTLSDFSLFEEFKEIGWPSSSVVYRDDTPYDYYLFEGEDTSTNIKRNKTFLTPDEIRKISFTNNEDIPGIGTAEQLNTAALPMSEYGPDNILYWLRYCAMATLVNCMMPIYWSTGLLIAGTPLLLPIVYIPICVIPGRIITVIGIGLCGIMPSPMVLFANLSGLNGCILIPLNFIVDTIIKQLNTLKSQQYKTVEISMEPMLASLDNEINSIQQDLLNLDYQIQEVKSVSIDFKTNQALKKRRNKDLSKKSKKIV